jgi:RNA polymerase sigma-54 factor
MESQVHLGNLQNLTITPKLQQAISLLQMSCVELQQFVNQQIESNPLLEFVDSYDDHSRTSNLENFSLPNYSSEKKNDYESYVAGKKMSLSEFLLQQINIIFTKKTDKKIAEYFVELLSEDGYFRENLPLLSVQLGVNIKNLENILLILQTFEPSGIFARSLKECLTIQLQDNKKWNPKIEKFLDLIVQNPSISADEIIKKISISKHECGQFLNDLRSLNPNPVFEWSHNEYQHFVPDVFVESIGDDQFSVELNMDAQPKILINSSYYQEIKTKIKVGSDKVFIKECYNNGNWLVKSLEQRSYHLLKVALTIVDHQKDFLKAGLDFLKPLSLKDIASKLDIHESTVSRICQDKYMVTPRGVFSFKFFFSHSMPIKFGSEITTNKKILQNIKDIIKNESSKKPLSDEDIANLFANNGTKIARRTVAKYRNILGIPSSSSRKQMM